MSSPAWKRRRSGLRRARALRVWTVVAWMPNGGVAEFATLSRRTPPWKVQWWVDHLHRTYDGMVNVEVTAP